VSNAYAGQFYPTAVRATGLGWALGIGRSGAILAPILIGVLVGMKLSLQQNFTAIALPAIFAMIAIVLINHSRSASAHRVGFSTGIPDAARVSTLETVHR
jgi:MFS transporter, AAHS family, benzoate transport protein